MEINNYKYSYIKYFPTQRHQLYIFGGVLLSCLVVVLALTLSTVRTSWFGRASSTTLIPTAISRENSYVFASPIQAAANGTSIIRITVFILNNQGLGVTSQKVELQLSGQADVAPTQPVTDAFGRAYFDLTSSNAGDYTVSAATSGLTLPQTVSISFR
ncbi:Ig-like domain-containing protein [Candidatus Microgenomates bacterium]|nr:Ig-like domain-containing protein [Candidatus Microgenomates bacterium]